jgi:hypothetical protein
MNPSTSDAARPLIYYLPGAGGELRKGLGEGILSRGFEVMGRETRGEFQRLEFQEKIDLVAQDLRAHFWRSDALVICNSYGCYLFFHAQIGREPFPGRLLLLSPIVGHFVNETLHRGYVPPRSTRLKELVEVGRFPTPLNAEIHVGSEDWQSHPRAVRKFGRLTGIPVHIIQGRGHELGRDVVGPLLDQFLSTRTTNQPIVSSKSDSEE